MQTDSQLPKTQEALDKRLDQLHDAYLQRLERLKLESGWSLDSIWGDEHWYPDDESRWEAACKEVESYNDKAAQAAADYFEQIRSEWSNYLGNDLPDFDRQPLPDAGRAVWKLAGGSNNTDYPGLRYEDVIPDANGQVHNKYGLRIDDLWPKHADLDQWKTYLRHVVSTSSRIGMLDQIGSDPSKPRWARVPVGETCEFCVMLASRGFVYLTRETASLGGGFHNGRCDCNVVPSWGERHIAGYDPDTLYRQYKSCADTISNLTTQDKYKDYLSALSDKEKAKAPEYKKWKRDLELAEMRWRDRTWLNTGTPPPVGYNPPELQRKISDIRPHEIRTAQRLADNGVKATFKIDVKKVPNENGKGTHDIGYADLENGIEIKTLKNTSSTNTINSHLKSTSKKPDAKTVVMDNSENDGMSDEDLIACIRRCLAFRGGKVYIIRHDGKLTRAR